MKLKMSILLIVAALGIAAVGSAALSDISFQRQVSGGQVLVDTDENVAVQITNISTNYKDLVKTDANGKVSLNLNEAIGNRKGTGFNTDADFSIGSPNNGVIRIKNNSDIALDVAMTNEAGNDNIIRLIPINGSGSTIEVGKANDFYFTINTQGQKATTALNAVLHIESK